MKKAKLGRSHSFFAPEVYLFILAALITVLLFGLIYLLFFSLNLLSVYSVIHFFKDRKREITKKLIKVKALADARLFFIKKLIYLSYETDKTLFHRKFRAAVYVKRLRETEVITVDLCMLNKKIERHMDEEILKKALTDNDIELCCLLLQNFSPSEITVIYNLKNIQSAYIKRHRLKRKLDSIGLHDIL